MEDDINKHEQIMEVVENEVVNPETPKTKQKGLGSEVRRTHLKKLGRLVFPLSKQIRKPSRN